MALTPQQLARQLRDLSPEQRVVCVHPNFKTQNLVLNALWENSVYVRFSGRDLGDEAAQTQLQAALRHQTGNSQPDGTTTYLLLDEADRVEQAALVRLLRRILAEFEGARVVLFSRVLLEALLDDADLRRQTAFLPRDAKNMLWDYSFHEGETLLEVRAFGEGRVHLNGRRVDSWDGALPRALFFYLVDRGMVTRAEIFQTFWPTLSTREATNVFHVTKRKISEVLRTELTVYGSSFYHISPRIQLSYDVSLFNQSLLESDSGGTGGESLREALALYRGDYLCSMTSDWVFSRREALQQAAGDALVALGKTCEANGSTQEALGFYLRASRLRPEREDAAYASMRIYRDLDLREDALHVYRMLEKTLRKTLNVTPSPQIQQLAAQLGQ